MDHVFAALGEPVRRRILVLLSAGEQPVGAVVESLRAGGPISQPAVSQHLKVLREAGLVTKRAEGTRRLYLLDPTGIAAASAWLSALSALADPMADPLAGLAQPLDALATEVARGRRLRRPSVERGTGRGGGGEQERLA